jgi:class 3 adenylate cyclase
MTQLPSGTVTFLFTDIEGSTDLAQRYPDALPSLLARHHAILRQAIEAVNGFIFKTIGDAVCAAFHTAPDALGAALEAQRMLQAEPWGPAPLRVRMGIHTGSAQVRMDGDLASDYEGYGALARVQRVMSAAHGGQTLLSNASAELLRDVLPAGISLRDLGEHRLKGLSSSACGNWLRPTCLRSSLPSRHSIPYRAICPARSAALSGALAS